jgi:hypothetical protein
MAPLIGFLVPVESRGRCELKTAQLHASGVSLTDHLSNTLAWWTPTAKAKAGLGTALALRLAHSLGMLHEAAAAENVLFDVDRRIPIVDFSGPVFR